MSQARTLLDQLRDQSIPPPLTLSEKVVAQRGIFLLYLDAEGQVVPSKDIHVPSPDSGQQLWTWEAVHEREGSRFRRLLRRVVQAIRTPQIREREVLCFTGPKRMTKDTILHSGGDEVILKDLLAETNGKKKYHTLVEQYFLGVSDEIERKKSQANTLMFMGNKNPRSVSHKICAMTIGGLGYDHASFQHTTLGDSAIAYTKDLK